jgi:hypothetical protein
MFCHADGTTKTVGEVYASVVNRPPQIPAMSTTAQPQMLAADIAGPDMGNVSTSVTNTSIPELRGISLSDDDKAQKPVAPKNTYAIWPSADRPPAAPQLRLLPQPPVVLSAGIVEMLAQLTPAATMRRAI